MNMKTPNPENILESRLIQRFSAVRSPMGRGWLNFKVHCQRFAWRVAMNSGWAMKRLLDIVFSAAFLILASPLFLLVAVLIKLGDGGPVFFAQTRVGRFGQPFKMYKFRSMCMDAEAKLKDLLARNNHVEGVTFKLKDDPRLTRVGKWLRKFSLDEFPQFYNVLRGDMTLVGPRPPVPREVAKYSLADRRRLSAKPGLTCIWQVSGRSEIDFSGQVKLDVNYIESRSFWLDIKIIASTVPAVLSGKGAC
jgi:lipopolysaccharide/colanic/teichoic acid biosynthesis glycosyltransferase